MFCYFGRASDKDSPDEAVCRDFAHGCPEWSSRCLLAAQAALSRVPAVVLVSARVVLVSARVVRVSARVPAQTLHCQLALPPLIPLGIPLIWP